MVRILSQSGNSLADIYDVRGSIAGIDNLETRDLPIVHEMGATVFSERLSGRVQRGSSTAVLQNITWDIQFTDIVESGAIGRLAGVTVFADTGARVSNASLLLVDDRDDREIPIFVWDSNEGIVVTRLSDAGGAAANVDVLAPANGGEIPPVIILGSDQARPLGTNIFFRGLSTGFGAGTVEVIALLHILTARVQGLSSRGLPVPSW